MKMNRQAHQIGFTLVELMITLTILGVMLTIAAPNFQNVVKNNRIATETNRLLADLQFARSEAMKRGVRVVLCRSGNPAAAAPTCGGTANTWTNGWLIFASGDSNDTYDSATDTLLRVAQASTGTLTVKSNSTPNNGLEFNANSSTNEGGATARFAVCDDRGATYGRMIEIPPVGKPRLASSVSSCTAPS